MWRDSGFAVGALTAGLLADTLTMSTAIAAIAGLTFVSGTVVAAVMFETLPAWRKVVPLEGPISSRPGPQ